MIMIEMIMIMLLVAIIGQPRHDARQHDAQHALRDGRVHLREPDPHHPAGCSYFIIELLFQY